ncbi:Flagellar basal body-associated protein FliL [Sphingomonas gellani]|uniref:Flagellar protein FliL n=1 Tax=Sphingomonas gellani TaxID=1166340 RepID=A0A1H8C7P3_9SPHN|nr:flagellar basal body-associated FliL family protein [Sphingomonas gellani]SEM91103.1 Flagellar basal body-associated protein FliL [Sphingomonas gellani]
MARKAIIAGAAGALLIVAGGAGAGFWMSRDGIAGRLDSDAGRADAAMVSDADNASTALVRQATPIYYSFDPPFVVNVKQSGAVIQVGMSVSTHYAATGDALKNDDPALRSVMLGVLGDVTEAMADDDTAKQQLQTRIMAAVNRQLSADGYAGNVDGAFFTSFLLVDNGDG